MTVAIGIASIALFLFAFWRLDLVRVAAGALATARTALATMRDGSLDDATREKRVQAASIRLTGAFVSIAVRGAVALGVSLLPIWLGDVSGLAAGGEVIGFLSRWDVILVASAVIVAGYVLRARLSAQRS